MCAALDSRACTEQSRRLVDHLFTLVANGGTNGKRGVYARTRDQLRRGVEGFVADLLRAQNNERAQGWAFKSLHKDSFVEEEVKYTAFTQLVDRLVELGLVEQKRGYRQTFSFDPGGPSLAFAKYASRFRATEALLATCAQYGVAAAEAKDHFITDLPSKPLQLRSGSTRNEWGQKIRGRSMPFEHTELTQELEAQVRELNKFLNQFELRGGTHRGYVRIFAQGDTENYRWNLGGRLYSLGEDSYQQMAKEDRLKMTISGEPVCEIDIRASYLTLFHAFRGFQIDLSADPYTLPKLGPDARDVVKGWFVATFGSQGHIKKWPRNMTNDYRERTGRRLGQDYALRAIRTSALNKFPILSSWGESAHDSWASLMFNESVAVIGAMLDLMGLGVPSLGVHDSLLVPASKRAVAMEHLTARYRWVTRGPGLDDGVEPKLIVHDPRPPQIQ